MFLYKIVYFLFFVFCSLFAFLARADINIAVIAPLSGDFKLYSEEIIGGVEIAVDEINEKGGLKKQKINLVRIDDPCGDVLSLTTAEMISLNRSQDDKIQLVIGPLCYNQSEKIADLFASSEIFQIHPLGGSRSLYQHSHKEVVEMLGDIKQQAVDFFRYYMNSHQEKKLAVVYDSTHPEMTEISREIQHLFTKSGLGDKLTAFSLEAFADNSEQLAKHLNETGVDVVFIMANSDLTIETILNVKKTNSEMIFFVNRYYGGYKLIRKLGSYAEGLYIVSLPSLTSNPNFAEYLVKLRLLGIEPVGLMPYGYLAVKMWEYLVEQEKGVNYKGLQNKLNNHLIPAGWGNVVYKDGIPDRSLKYVIYRYENEGYTQVW